MRQEMHLFCLIRLLDVSACARNQSLDLTLVFEYIDQDLTTFMNCAEHGLSREKIKVTPVNECIPLVFKHNTIFLFLLFTITILIFFLLRSVAKLLHSVAITFSLRPMEVSGLSNMQQHAGPQFHLLQ